MSNRRKARGERGTLPVPRDQAIADIAAHLMDRDAFVISVPPALVPTAAYRLKALTACTWYSDNGTGIIMRPAAKRLHGLS
jgi:hypothetical protein